MIWNREAETLDRASLAKLQLERLQSLVTRLYGSVPFYKGKLDPSGAKPASVRSLADLAALPFTGKDELRETYPYGLLAVAPQEIVEIHTSSGTTGKPVVDAYTQSDIEVWGEVMARTLAMGGTTASDVVQNAYGYGLFTGGLGVHYGARRIGANVIPISGGNTARLHALIQPVPGRGRTRRRHGFLQAAAQGRPVRRRALEREHAQGDRGQAARPGD
jgi:phenylacetate-CoA ligase